MELQGKVIAALPPRSGESARGKWVVQEFVIETFDSQYPRKMVFDVFGEDRLQRFNIQIGQTVNVAFDIDAREWNGRWYNSIRAFDVRQVDPNAAPMPGGFAEPAAYAAPPVSGVAAPSTPVNTEAAGAAADPLGGAAAEGDSSSDLPF